MPKSIEDDLEAAASKKNLIGDKRNAYIFGTLAKIGKARKIGAKSEKDEIKAPKAPSIKFP